MGTSRLEEGAGPLCQWHTDTDSAVMPFVISFVLFTCRLHRVLFTPLWG